MLRVLETQGVEAVGILDRRALRVTQVQLLRLYVELFPVALAEMAASRALPVSAVHSALEGRAEQLVPPAFQEMAAMEATAVLALLVSTD